MLDFIHLSATGVAEIVDFTYFCINSVSSEMINDFSTTHLSSNLPGEVKTTTECFDPVFQGVFPGGV